MIQINPRTGRPDKRIGASNGAAFRRADPKKVIEDYMKLHTLDSAGKVNGISRERVRQILVENGMVVKELHNTFFPRIIRVRIVTPPPTHCSDCLRVFKHNKKRERVGSRCAKCYTKFRFKDPAFRVMHRQWCNNWRTKNKGRLREINRKAIKKYYSNPANKIKYYKRALKNKKMFVIFKQPQSQS